MAAAGLAVTLAAAAVETGAVPVAAADGQWVVVLLAVGGLAAGLAWARPPARVVADLPGVRRAGMPGGSLAVAAAAGLALWATGGPAPPPGAEPAATVWPPAADPAVDWQPAAGRWWPVSAPAPPSAAAADAEGELLGSGPLAVAPEVGRLAKLTPGPEAWLTLDRRDDPPPAAPVCPAYPLAGRLAPLDPLAYTTWAVERPVWASAASPAALRDGLARRAVAHRRAETPGLAAVAETGEPSPAGLFAGREVAPTRPGGPPQWGLVAVGLIAGGVAVRRATRG
jgi:hypothetical protein